MQKTQAITHNKNSFIIYYNTMVEKKSIIESKTLWGIIIAGIAMAAKNYGVDIWDQWMLVNDILQIVWLILAVYGRVSATDKLI